MKKLKEEKKEAKKKMKKVKKEKKKEKKRAKHSSSSSSSSSDDEMQAWYNLIIALLLWTKFTLHFYKLYSYTSAIFVILL